MSSNTVMQFHIKKVNRILFIIVWFDVLAAIVAALGGETQTLCNSINVILMMIATILLLSEEHDILLSYILSASSLIVSISTLYYGNTTLWAFVFAFSSLTNIALYMQKKLFIISSALLNFSILLLYFLKPFTDASTFTQTFSLLLLSNTSLFFLVKWAASMQQLVLKKKIFNEIGS